MKVLLNIIIILLSLNVLAGNRLQPGAPVLVIASALFDLLPSISKQERSLLESRRRAKTDEEIKEIDEKLMALRFGKKQNHDDIAPSITVSGLEEQSTAVAGIPGIWTAPSLGAAPAASSGGSPDGGDGNGVVGQHPSAPANSGNETQTRAEQLRIRETFRPFFLAMWGYNPMFEKDVESVISREPSSAERPSDLNDSEYLEHLRRQYKPEFERLIPVIVNAIRCVLHMHSYVPQDLHRGGFEIYKMSNPSPISMDEYVKRIAEFSFISPATLLGGLIILDHLTGCHPDLLFSSINIFKFYLTALCIARKVMELKHCSNKHFADIGGISLSEMNKLEANMLTMLQFDPYISPEQLKLYIDRATNGLPMPIPFDETYRSFLEALMLSQR